ncbi:DNA-packaging protein [Candidatus Pacearchaeota archaeon]|nr:DNA-packaging protein [Candidatus Pacearchaeota archaeon]
MAAPKKNEFWKERTSHGRDKLFESKETYQAAIIEYFQWVTNNPLQEEIIQGGLRFTIDKMRAMTINGLCLYLDIDLQTFDNYSKKEGYKDFFGVSTWAREVIYTQKFEGASAGFLNANLITRDLGLAEKHDIGGSIGITGINYIIPDGD